MKKVLLFLVLMASLALVACGSKNEDGNGGDVPQMSSKDIPAADIPDKSGFTTKSGYLIEAGDKTVKYYIYKNSDNKIGYFNIISPSSSGNDETYGYEVSYSGDTAIQIYSTPAIPYNPITDKDQIKDVLQKLENKEFVKKYLD